MANISDFITTQTGGGGGGSAPINSYAAFYGQEDLSMYTDSNGSVWLRTGDVLTVGGTPNAQPFIDQGAHEFSGEFTQDSTFGTNGGVTGFDGRFVDSGARLDFDPIGNQWVRLGGTSAFGNTELFQTFSLDGSTIGTATVATNALYAGAVSPDGTRFFTTRADNGGPRGVYEVTGSTTYPYTVPATEVASGFGSSNLGGQLIVDDTYFYRPRNSAAIAGNFQIERITRTGGLNQTPVFITGLRQRDNRVQFAGWFQEVGNTDTFWVIENPVNDNSRRDPNFRFIRQYNFPVGNSTQFTETGNVLQLPAADPINDASAAQFAIDPRNEDVIALRTDIGFARYRAQIQVGDPTASYSFLRNQADDANARTLRNFVKIGNSTEE